MAIGEAVDDVLTQWLFVLLASSLSSVVNNNCLFVTRREMSSRFLRRENCDHDDVFVAVIENSQSTSRLVRSHPRFWRGRVTNKTGKARLYSK